MKGLTLAMVSVLALLLALAACGDEGEPPAGRGADREGSGNVDSEGRGERSQPRENGRGGGEEPGSASAIPDRATPTTVTDVADGDTVDLAGIGAARLVGVDTPETYGGAKCFGAEASAFTKRRLAPGTEVRYTFGAERRDRYGRALVYIWRPDGSFINAELARRGFAVPLTIAPNTRYADLFDRLAAEARREERGLWASSTCGGDADQPAGGEGGREATAGTDRGSGGDGNCDPNYSGCVPRYPPDIDCADVDGPVTVRERTRTASTPTAMGVAASDDGSELGVVRSPHVTAVFASDDGPRERLTRRRPVAKLASTTVEKGTIAAEERLDKLYREHPGDSSPVGICSPATFAPPAIASGPRRWQGSGGPTAAAWLLNRAALSASAELEELAEAGRELQAAQDRALASKEGEGGAAGTRVARLGGRSREELVAGLGSTMLCGTVGSEPVPLEGSAAYIAKLAWALRDDRRMVVVCAAGRRLRPR